MKKFYIHNGQTEQGPLTFNEIKTLNLKTDTPIWYEGLENWSKAGDIDELKDILNGHSTPPPFQKKTPPVNQPTTYTPEEPVENNNRTVLYIRLAIIIGAVISVWLIYQYNRTESIVHAQQIQLDEQAEKELERQRINEQLTQKNRNYRNNWFNYIQAGHGSYNYSVLGGITNLEIEVGNSTEYLLEEVIVNVSYIKDNGGIWKAESVILNNIPPNASKTVSAPNSERGTSVKVEITGITSKKMHFCYYPGKTGNNVDDPYFCRI
jgi:hypothetical protein